MAIPSFLQMSASALKTLDTISQPQSRIVNVVGGDPDAIRKILKWTVDCCKGQGRVHFPFAEKESRYTLTYLDRQAALVLSIPWVVDEADTHLRNLEANFIHPHDVRAIVPRLEWPDEVYQRLAKHIADKTWQDMQKRQLQKRKKNVDAELLARERLPSDGFVPVRKEFPITLGAEVDKIIEARLRQGRTGQQPRIPQHGQSSKTTSAADPSTLKSSSRHSIGVVIESKRPLSISEMDHATTSRSQPNARKSKTSETNNKTSGTTTTPTKLNDNAANWADEVIADATDKDDKHEVNNAESKHTESGQNNQGYGPPKMAAKKKRPQHPEAGDGRPYNPTSRLGKLKGNPFAPLHKSWTGP
ncbi:hypothetical protein LTR64_000319 [Lithohypha guttulata]|uniref:uncharacterized protein n=1 Tax=Lithohypha guttulata TaxID=1690604 RepID=UPI00315D1818